MQNAKAVQHFYNDMVVDTEGSQASPHRVVQMLLEGAISRIRHAKGGMLHKDYSQCGSNIGKAITLVGVLHDAVDREHGGEIAENLFQLYSFVSNHLLMANVQQKPEMLDECLRILENLKEGWESIEHAIPTDSHLPTDNTPTTAGK